MTVSDNGAGIPEDELAGLQAVYDRLVGPEQAEGGRAPDTPVAAVRNGTRPDQSTVRATLATIVAAVAVGFAINPLIAAAIYLTVSLNLWRMAPHHVRLDRMARGFAIEAVVAATGETGAIAAYTELNPKARFVFGPQSNSGSADGGLAKAA